MFCIPSRAFHRTLDYVFWFFRPLGNLEIEGALSEYAMMRERYRAVYILQYSGEFINGNGTFEAVAGIDNFTAPL